MFSHFTLGSNDLKRSERFYDAVMASLCQTLIAGDPNDSYLMFAPADQRYPHLFVCRPFDGLPATWSNGFHIAFNAPDKETVDQFHTAAMAAGGYDEGAPGIRPDYDQDYYGAYVRDPDGNKLQAVCYTAGRRAGSTGDVVSHITIGHADLERERAFYSAILTALGIAELPEEGDDESTAFGLTGFDLPVLYLQPAFDGRPATWGNGTHTAFAAPSRAAVNRFHAAGLAHGGVCDGAPGLRPQYSQHYYAAYLRDAVGNKLQAVCRNPE
ncbi:VOC family protein [Pelagibius sp. Alg239-R121]|uniref:VOC family protein n=1 Tax=Pelagibius sp. Alg239-R121 TaxID=2993448 RepID=UPI0024A66701|nr:VOC family protein [Pelagibius sp. Alg239-R121]